MGNSGSAIKVNKADVVKTFLIDGDIIELGDSVFKIKLL